MSLQESFKSFDHKAVKDYEHLGYTTKSMSFDGSSVYMKHEETGNKITINIDTDNKVEIVYS